MYKGLMNCGKKHFAAKMVDSNLSVKKKVETEIFILVTNSGYDTAMCKISNHYAMQCTKVYKTIIMYNSATNNRPHCSETNL
jgi:hypothetical protein